MMYYKKSELRMVDLLASLYFLLEAFPFYWLPL